ncbi:hypothetical protein ASF71_21210 [Deinococcus sp. Leaf326]|nr:hypothetical protein ASF71_21210 [Deinococcus sp. Leaf326]
MLWEVKISDTLPPADQLFLQCRQGAGTEIPQNLALHVRPDQLDGIELGRIGRQIHQREAFVASHERLNCFGAMDAGIVQHHHDVSLDMA